MIFTLLPLAGLGALAMFTFLHSWFGLDEAITYAATHDTIQEVHKEATGQLALKALGWMILLWLTSLLCLWYAAVYANAGF